MKKIFSIILFFYFLNPPFNLNANEITKMKQLVFPPANLMKEKKYHQSIELAKEILEKYHKNDKYSILLYLIIAKNYKELKQYKLALNVYFKALKKIQDLKKNEILTPLLALNYYLIGDIFYSNKEYNQSIIYYRKELFYDKNYNNLIKAYNKVIDKNLNIYAGEAQAELAFGSIKFLESGNLYFKSLKYFKENDFKNSLIYVDKTINFLNRMDSKEDELRIKILLTHLYQIKGNIYYLKKHDINKAYHFFEKAYIYSMNIRDFKINLIKHYTSNKDYFEFRKNKLKAYKYFYEENYPKAYKYINMLIDYRINKFNKILWLKSYLYNAEKFILNKKRYLTNNSSFLNIHSLFLSTSYAYKKSLLTTKEKEKNISSNSLNKWINYKGINFLQENKKLKNINYKSISKYLSKNQIYIDIASGSQNNYIFTLNRDNNITFEEFSKKETSLINEYIYAFRDINNKMVEAMRDKNLDKEKLKVEAQEILSKLYNILISKYLSKQLKDKKELIISPDGLLNFLPFEALYHNEKYLIEDYNIKYISSGREFIRQIRRKETKPKNNIIYFGSPDFNISLPISKTKKPMINSNQNVAMETWTQYKNFSPIGDEELKSIQKFYSDIKIYKGKNATIDNLMKIDSPKILHLSTHGKFLNNDNILNPMQKAGLAFVGANDKNSNMGIATALKLSTLNLQDTELVVLSACESGLGEIQNSEGVMGLPKAFFQAGARYVIMSLWSISNQKTAELMDKFYKHLKEGKRYDIALREAKLEMIQEGLHPYYWSAFIIHGI